MQEIEQMRVQRESLSRFNKSSAGDCASLESESWWLDSIYLSWML